MLENRSMRKGSLKEEKPSLFLNSGVIVFCLFLLFFVFFAVISEEFFSLSMFSIILLTGAELGIIAIGVTLLIVCGEIDLSTASVFVFSNFVVLTFSNWGLPLYLSFLIALFYGCLAGFLNGFISLRFEIPSFIVTLGSLLFWRGALAGLTYGEPVYLGKKFSILFSLFGGQIWYFPKLFFWFLGFALFFGILLNHSKFGNWILATGGSSETARALGVNVYRTKLICFMISSALAAFAGAAYVVRSNYLDTVVATGFELEAIASAVVGGTLLSGGIGSIAGTALCSFLLKEIQVGIATLGIRAEYYNAVIGCLLVISAAINSQLIRKIIKI